MSGFANETVTFPPEVTPQHVEELQKVVEETKCYINSAGQMYMALQPNDPGDSQVPFTNQVRIVGHIAKTTMGENLFTTPVEKSLRLMVAEAIGDQIPPPEPTPPPLTGRQEEDRGQSAQLPTYDRENPATQETEYTPTPTPPLSGWDALSKRQE